LRGLSVQIGVLDLANDDCVCFAEHVQFFLGDVYKATNGQARPWKWMPPDQVFGQPELHTEFSHFVFEQIAKRLNQFEAQFVR
jgi:hypothetical protein